MRPSRTIASSVLIIMGVALTGCGPSLGGHGLQSNTSAPSVTSEPTTNSTNQPNTPAKNGTKKPNKPSQPAYPSVGIGSSGSVVLALNERLAELGYLPVEIAGGATPSITLSNVKAPPGAQFVWRYENVPDSLQMEWSPDTYTEMTRGAVMAFESQNGLAVDGVASSQVWQKMLSHSAAQNASPYTYVLVTKDPAPEKLQVWQAGRWIFSSICNTGVQQAPTTNGTFAVYLRYQSQTMTGTNPDGSHYSDPGVEYVNYFNGGEAIHAFDRNQYGFPQSVGCVELPTSAAQTVWSLLSYGTLVTVTGNYVAPVPISSQKPAQSSSTTPKSHPSTPASKDKPGSNQTSGKTNSTGGNQSSSGGSPSRDNSSSGGNSTSGSSGSSTGNSTGGNSSDGGNSTSSGTSTGGNSTSKGNSTAGDGNASGANSTSGTHSSTSNSTASGSGSSNNSSQTK